MKFCLIHKMLAPFTPMQYWKLAPVTQTNSSTFHIYIERKFLTNFILTVQNIRYLILFTFQWIKQARILTQISVLPNLQINTIRHHNQSSNRIVQVVHNQFLIRVTPPPIVHLYSKTTALAVQNWFSSQMIQAVQNQFLNLFIQKAMIQNYFSSKTV